jgi:NAD(P)-dependent dehydrogenase (short-subunit alcohol dehydrogenase family)
MDERPDFEHVIVIGGSSAIGAAVVDLLGARGAAVTVLDLQPSDREGVATEIADPRDETTVEAAIENAFARGAVSGLVASHGVRGEYVPALEIELESLRRLYGIRVIGTLAVSRAIVRRLGGAPGSIVMISSTAAYGGWANQVDYGLARAAVSKLVEHLTIEWAPRGVRVNAVAPGPHDNTHGAGHDR